MKTLTKRTALVVIVAGFSSFSALGLPIAYDGFDYPLTNLIGNINPDGYSWDLAGPAPSTNNPTVIAGSLSYPGLAPSVGNKVQFGGIDSNGGMAARFSLKSLVSSGTLYYSFIMQITDTNNLSTSGIFFIGFNNSSGPQGTVPSVVGTRVVARLIPEGGFQIGLDKSSGGAANFQWYPYTNQLGDTFFVVGSYTFNPNLGDDVSMMWVNPDPATFGAASAPTTNVLTSTAGSDLNGNQIGSFCLFNRNAGEPHGVIVDELTIGTTWADVTPTATALAIVTQPKDQRIVAGGTATFEVTAFRAQTYQWQHKGVDIQGATNTTLTINNASLSDAGNYTVTIGNGVSTVTSSNAVLTVYEDVYSRLAPLWSIAPFSRAYMTTDPSQSPNQRYFAYNTLSNQVLIVSRTNTVTGASTGMVYVLDAGTGADLYQMNTDSGILTGGLNNINLNAIDVADDGAVYGGNISDANSAISFRLYRWENSGSNAVPANIYDGDPFGLGIERYGDSLAVRGSGTNTEILLDDSKGLYGAIMQPADETLSFFNPFAFTNVIGGLTGGRTVLFGEANTFWEKHRGAGLQHASFDLTNFTSTVLTNYNGFPSTLGVVGFNFDLNLLCGINFLDNTNAPDALDLFDITDPNLPVLITSYNFPVNSQPNANRCGRVVFSGDKVFALDANNGFLAFTVVPRMTIASSGGDVLVSWPAAFTGFTLTASPELGPSATWTSVSTGTIVGSEFVVTNVPGSGNLFYRLQK